MELVIGMPNLEKKVNPITPKNSRLCWKILHQHHPQNHENVALGQGEPLLRGSKGKDRLPCLPESF